MLCRAEMLRRVLIPRIVATTDVAARPAQAKMHPCTAGRQSLFAAGRVGAVRQDEVEVTARDRHNGIPSLRLGRLDDQLGHFGGMGQHRDVARRQRDRLRFHAFSELPLEIRLNHPIIACNDVPRGLGFPGGA